MVTLSDGTWEMVQPRYEAAAVFIAADGSKWFGKTYSSDGGLLVLSPDGQHSWHYYRTDLEDIRRISGDAAGNRWFFTYRDGVIQLSPGE